jgi:diguanylate cyclase (GGDEF)-like protein/PAS domain S-box-containing protein
MGFDFEKFFSASPDLLCVIGLDGSFRHINGAFEKVLGWPPQTVLRRPAIEFVHPEDVGATVSRFAGLSRGENVSSFTNRLRCAEGQYRHLNWSACVDPDAGLVYANARDVTEFVEETGNIWMALDYCPTAMIKVDTHGIIRLANRKAQSIFGYSSDEFYGLSVEILVPPQFREQLRHGSEALFETPVTARRMFEGTHLSAVRKDGRVFPIEIGLSPLRMNDGLHVLVSIIELTAQSETEKLVLGLINDLEQANLKLLNMASTDILTSLKNRRAFDEKLGMLTSLAHRNASPLSLLMIDIDHFKAYNDEYGHLAGDEALKILAGILAATARQSDVVARYGGEEFVVILPDTDEPGARHLAERFREAVQDHGWEKRELTISLGAATLLFEEDQAFDKVDSINTLLRRADQALYHSKNNGRNRATHVIEMPSVH